MQILQDNFKRLCEKVRMYETRHHRPPNSVQIIAVSKKKSAEAILALHELGQRDFGESYFQEADAKIQALRAKNLSWHFIGNIQSNKTQLIAKNFDWVHSVDRIKVAERLNGQRLTQLEPLNICLQINLDQESQKSGINLIQLPEIATYISTLPQLKLRGLMAIPARKSNMLEQRKTFAQLRDAQEQLRTMGFELDALSMGMSHDMEAAIAEGATMIRIGTALFGARN